MAVFLPSTVLGGREGTVRARCAAAMGGTTLRSSAAGQSGSPAMQQPYSRSANALAGYGTRKRGLLTLRAGQHGGSRLPTQFALSPRLSCCAVRSSRHSYPTPHGPPVVAPLPLPAAHCAESRRAGARGPRQLVSGAHFGRDPVQLRRRIERAASACRSAHRARRYARMAGN